jgi:hypothetical protein
MSMSFLSRQVCQKIGPGVTLQTFRFFPVRMPSHQLTAQSQKSTG